MKRNKIDNQIEKLILIGMITSDEFLRDIQEIYNSEWIEIPYVSMISGWCLNYWKEYQKAPKKHIQDIFYEKADSGIENELLEQIQSFLENLSEDYENESNVNIDYLLKQAEKRFQSQSLKYLSEDLKFDIENNKIDDAKELLQTHSIPEFPSSESVNPYKDREAIETAFTETKKPLIRYPGPLGRFWNDQLVRDGFVAFTAPEKRGKSWWLMDMAYRGARQQNNVAMFQVGDMSQNQMIRRMAVHLSRRSDRKKYCGAQYMPIPDCELNQSGKCEKDECAGFKAIQGDFKDKGNLLSLNSEHEPCTHCVGSPFFKLSPWYDPVEIKPLHWSTAVKLGRKFTRRMKGKEIKLSTYPNDSVNVQKINDVLDGWESKYRFIADIIIIDYADILAPEPGSTEFRHQVNKTWKALRGLSQKRNCLVITATQADAGSYDRRSLGLGNFSEDKRKYAHVTAMYGLNQQLDEKIKGIMRLGKMVVREDEFDITNEINVLYNLRVGRPFLSSFF